MDATEYGVKRAEKRQINAYHRVSWVRELETNLTLDTRQHVIVNDLITNCVTATAIWTIAAGTRYAWTHRKMHCLIAGNRFGSTHTHTIYVFQFSFRFFPPNDTFDQISRIYVFSTVGLGHGRATMSARRDFSRNARIVVRVLSACRRISSERTKRKKSQKQNNNKKLIGSHSDRDDFFSFSLSVRFRRCVAIHSAQSDLPVCVIDC